MKLTTCGNCPHVKLYKTDLFTTTYCGFGGANERTEIIVPHNYDSEANTIEYTRVPDFCEYENAETSEKSAPMKDWITIKLKGKK